MKKSKKQLLTIQTTEVNDVRFLTKTSERGTEVTVIIGNTAKILWFPR